MNTKKTILAALFAAVFATPLAVAPVQAQIQAQAAQRAYTQAELDQMLAPIALYPDGLLSQVLMAATYPLEVVEAARWSRANSNLQGDAAVRAVENEDWDPSVKSLVAFPQILQRMDEQLNWTESLGDAFLAQEAQLMDSVQHLRRRAQTAGNLQSSEQIYVQQQGPTILIQSASPQYVYVPYYDPMVVYGTWWWPAYRPVHWSPWPGYARPYRPGYTTGFWWGQPIGLSVNFFFGNVDWRQRHVHVVHPRAYYYRPPMYVNRTVVVDRGRWQHDPHHRRGVDYRAADVRQRFSNAQMERRDDRRDDRRVERRDDRQVDRRDDRRDERRDDRRDERRDDRRGERQAAPAAVPAQTQPQPSVQPRSEQRTDRRAEQQSAMEAQRQAWQRTQEGQRQAQQQQARQQAEAARAQQQQQRQQAETARVQQRQQAEAARAQQQQQRQQAEAARAQPQQQRQEQRATMPAAQTQQTPRADRQDQRQERREQREERGQKG